MQNKNGAPVTKKRGRPEENQSQQPAKRRKTAETSEVSAASSSAARNPYDMPSLDELSNGANKVNNDAMDVDSAPNLAGSHIPASASSSSSSSAAPNIKIEPVASSAQSALDVLVSAATYDPNAVMPEQSADQSTIPPILLSAAFKDVKNLESFRENLQNIKDLVARHVSGAEVISVGLTDAQKSVFLAAIIEYGNSDKATEFLINHVEDSQKLNVLLFASQTIASTLSTRALDIILQNNSVQLNKKNIQGLNLLHWAAQNKDGGKMIAHILSKLSVEDKKVMLASTTTKGNTPLMKAAALGDAQGFDLLMENGQSLKEIKDNHNLNLLHAAASNKDGGVMIQHILSKLSAEDKKAMLAATTTTGKTPLMQAARFGDAKGFEALQSVTENWKQNQETLKVLVLATQKNAEFKKHFEENYPNEYKLAQDKVNVLPKASAPSAMPQQVPQQLVEAIRALQQHDPQQLAERLRAQQQQDPQELAERLRALLQQDPQELAERLRALPQQAPQQLAARPRALQPQAQPSAGRVSPPNNQNGMQNLPAPALQPASIPTAPQFPANILPDSSHAVERAVESLNHDLGFSAGSSSPSVVPPLASSGSLNANPSNALTQTAMSSLDLFKAFEQSIKNGPQTAISPIIMDKIKGLGELVLGHEAVIVSKKQSDDAPSRGI